MTAAPAAYEPVLAPDRIALNYQTVETNGSPLTGYLVSYTDVTNPAGSGSFTTFADVGYEIYTPLLTAGDFYFFTMAAENAVGVAPQSPPSATVQVWTTPGPATDVTAVAGDGSATVTWKLPAFNGYTPLRLLPTVTDTDLTTGTYGGEGAATATSAVFTSLINGHSYSFTVELQNYVEYSDSAPSLPVTPSAQPVSPGPTAPPAPVAPPVVSPGPQPVVTGTSLPAGVALAIDSRPIPFTVKLNRPTGITVALMHGSQTLAETAVAARGRTVQGSVSVHLPPHATVEGPDRWVVSTSPSGSVLATRAVTVTQSSALGLAARRSGRTITVDGVARWADLARDRQEPWTGRVIVLQEFTGGRWRGIAARRSGPGGTVLFRVNSRRRVELRLVDGGTAAIAGTTSRVRIL